MQNNATTETPDFGVSLHIRGRKSGEVTTDDRGAAAMQCLYFIDSLFGVLQLASADSLSRTDSCGLETTLESFCELGTALIQEACAHVDRLEKEREELATALEGNKK
jgi:hypothetical protein